MLGANLATHIEPEEMARSCMFRFVDVLNEISIVIGVRRKGKQEIRHLRAFGFAQSNLLVFPIAIFTLKYFWLPRICISTSSVSDFIRGFAFPLFSISREVEVRRGYS